MNKEEALKLRDEHRSKLIGQLVDKNSKWVIKDIIIATSTTAGLVYEKMWQDNLTNEIAIAFFPQSEEYTVFLISHEWPWGSGNLIIRLLTSYLGYSV